jgi:cation diffusion facilitator family transporter
MAGRTHDDAARAAAVRRVLLVTLGLNVAVACAKIAYGHATHVLSIRADGFHSLTDSSNNLIGLVGVWLASRPADEDHPYGHAKFEVIAAGLIGLSLLGMAVDVVYSSYERLTGAVVPPPSIDAGAFIVLLATLAVNVGVARWEGARGKALDSPFLLSDAAHTRSDVLVTLGVLVTVVLVRGGWAIADVVAAIGVAGFIGWAGVRVLRQNLGYLADSARLEASLVERIACGVPGVASAHKVRTRGMPGNIYVDLHIQVAPTLTVVEGHRVTHWVIDAIKSEVSGVRDVLVHTEPARPDQPYKPLPEPSDEGGRG